MQAEATFLPDINNQNIYSSILQYQCHTNSVIEGLKCVYRCFGLFALKKKCQLFALNDCLIHNFVISGLPIIYNIDSCGISNNNICLYLICKRLLLLRNQPNLRIFNGLPCAGYQSHLFALGHLFIAKKAAIAYVHLVVSILKFRPSRTFNPAANSGIKGHAVFPPQNSAHLLTFLPFPTLALHDIIRIVWAERRHLTNLDLQNFILVRKETFVNAMT